MKPSDLVNVAVSRGGEAVRQRAFDMADDLIAYVADEAGADAFTSTFSRDTVYRALCSAFCAGYLCGNEAPKRDAS
jgi:hypothetical protein